MNKRNILWAIFAMALLIGGTAFYLEPRLVPATPLSNASGEPRSLSDLVNFTKISNLKETTLTPLSTDWESALATIQQYQGTAPVYNEACSKYSCPGGMPIPFSNTPQTLLPQKPAPGSNDHFGYSVASVGSDILVGTPSFPSEADQGAAWLFDNNGNLLTTFREPTPVSGDWFGISVANAGGNILIGSYETTVGTITGAGAAYLFRNNGTLLTTYHEPTTGTNDRFGLPVAGFGNDVLVGSPFSTVNGLANAGAAYLFDSNGNLLVAYHEPSPGSGDNFGISISVIGDDILIGSRNTTVSGIAAAGAAYLFDSSGHLLNSYHEPTPVVNGAFGFSTANVAGNVLVATSYANRTGSAYLFNARGILLATYHEPTPSASDRFGLSLAGVGSNVLIGSPGTTVGGLSNAGAAYLFDNSGNLLTSYHEPTPGSPYQFGQSVTSSNGNAVIGTFDTTVGGIGNAGSAYVFDTRGNLLRTLDEMTRPTNGQFGISLAVVANNFVVGASQDNSAAGIVYILDNTGTIVRTLQEPVPHAGDEFGDSLAGVGSNLLVGAGGFGSAGSAYLFDNNGNLLATLREPGTNAFGDSVAAVGSDLLVGVPDNSTAGLSNAGAAYLFDSSGNLLTTFHEPTPAANDAFGLSVAGVNGNVFIGSPDTTVSGQVNAGSAYLFTSTGTLLTTYHEPTPATSDQFGATVASLGGSLLIGSPLTTVSSFSGAGAAYLFDGSGNLLTSYHDPVPATNDYFGSALIAAGGNILIGAYHTTVGGMAVSGAAYLFDSLGDLIRTFHEPAPAANDHFGNALASGTGIVLIGAVLTSVGGQASAGAAYLYRQFGLRDACAAATGTDCVVVTESGSFQAGPSNVPMNVVAVSLRSARNATIGTQMALTVMCNKAVADAGLQCSALYIDGNVWGAARDAFKGPFLIVNAEPYFYLQWHWWDPTNQRIVAWSYWWTGSNPDPNWYWTVYLYWRTYTANNLGVWTPWWWWWWHWTYYLYWNYWSAGVGFSTS